MSDARSLAQAYAATISEVNGLRLLSEDTAAACIPMHTTGSTPFGMPPELAARPARGDFGLGFIAGEKLSPGSFGHPGAGGSLAFADLATRLSFAYVPSRMGANGDGRTAVLVDAVRSCT